MSGFDLGEGRRRWRALDLGTTLAFVEADAPRVSCARHGVVVCAVPWARHKSRFTRGFEDQVCWLAVNCSKTAVAALMRIAWRSVGQICERVASEAQREVDLLAGLRRIGIETVSSYCTSSNGLLRSMLDSDGVCDPFVAGGFDLVVERDCELAPAGAACVKLALLDPSVDH